MHPVTSSAPLRALPALLAVCLAAVILPLNFSGGAIAALAIGRDLGGASTQLAWITNAFMLTFGSSLMAAGTLADKFGRKRVFMIGVVGMTAASAVLCLARDVLTIDVVRAVQGFAAAAALAGGSASLAQIFRGPALMRAYSALGTSFGVGLAFGPLIAGALIGHVGWRSIFAGIALVGIVAAVCGALRMPESRDPEAGGVDWRGAISFTLALACFTFALVQGPQYGWGSAPILGLLAGFVACAAFFIRTELRVARPMLDLSLFRFPRFIGVQVLPIGTCYCYIVLLVMLPLRFIGMGGLDELDAGLLMLALSAPMLVVPGAAAWLTRWVAAGTLAAGGLLVAAFGLYLMSRVPSGSGGAAWIPAMLVIGCGTGMPWGLMDGLSVTVVPTDRAGMATGIFSTTRVAGEGVALAVVMALLASLVHARLDAVPGVAAVDGRLAGALLAAGDLRQAQRIVPSVARTALLDDYDASFRTLLLVLAAVTVAASAITYACLTPRAEPAAAESLP